MQVTAQLAQLRDYTAMQGQDQRHGQQGHTDPSYGDGLGTHRASPSSTGAADVKPQSLAPGDPESDRSRHYRKLAQSAADG